MKVSADSLRQGIERSDSAQGVTTVKTPVEFEVPAKACDCHTHVFLDPSKFPFWEGRTYTPPEATADDLLAFQNALHFDRVVIVNPSVYGETLDATIAGMQQLGPQRARGIAAFSPHMQAAYLDHLSTLGFRGVRLNLDTAGMTDVNAAKKLIKAADAQVAARGWHIEMYLKASIITELMDEFSNLAAPVVFDHFAGADGTRGIDQPGFACVLDLLRAGKAYATLSGAYRASNESPDYRGFTPIAKALISANENHILWASDWPHPGGPKKPHKVQDTRPPYSVDDGKMLNLLPLWAPDAATRTKILATNAERLYKFG